MFYYNFWNAIRLLFNELIGKCKSSHNNKTVELVSVLLVPYVGKPGLAVCISHYIHS